MRLQLMAYRAENNVGYDCLRYLDPSNECGTSNIFAPPEITETGIESERLVIPDEVREKSSFPLALDHDTSAKDANAENRAIGLDFLRVKRSYSRLEG